MHDFLRRKIYIHELLTVTVLKLFSDANFFTTGK